MLGSWLTYGLGSEAENLPAYVVLSDPTGLPVLGVDNWTNGWLPSLYQGTVVRRKSRGFSTSTRRRTHARGTEALPRVPGGDSTASICRQHPGEDDLDARIASYELAANMQTAAKEALDISGETAETQQLYGIDQPETQGLGHALPDRAAAGRARRAVRAGLLRAIRRGTITAASKRPCRSAASRPTSRPPRWCRT